MSTAKAKPSEIFRIEMLTLRLMHPDIADLSNITFIMNLPKEKRQILDTQFSRYSLLASKAGQRLIELDNSPKTHVRVSSLLNSMNLLYDELKTLIELGGEAQAKRVKGVFDKAYYIVRKLLIDVSLRTGETY